MHLFQKQNFFKSLIAFKKPNLLIKTQLRTLMDFDPKKDYYKILGLTADASEKEIKTAYYKMAKKYHPDLNGGKQSNEFKEMSNAYDILSDVNKKKDYDALRRSESGPNPFYANARQRPSNTTGGFNGYSNNSEYYNDNFEEKIREKFRRAGFNNEKFSKFQYKDPKTGEWKSYGSAQGNPFFKDFEDLFKKASQQQAKYGNSYSQYTTYNSEYNKQNPFGSDSRHKNNKNEQFYNEDLNDPNRFSNMGYNPYTQNQNENNYYNKNNSKFNGDSGKSNQDYNNFNYDYTPIILQQYLKRIIVVFGVFVLISVIFKKKARDDYYFTNGLGNANVNQAYYSYSQFAEQGGNNTKKKEEELDPYDERVKIKVK